MSVETQPAGPATARHSGSTSAGVFIEVKAAASTASVLLRMDLLSPRAFFRVPDIVPQCLKVLMDCG
jgi:hypothetical protein